MTTKITKASLTDFCDKRRDAVNEQAKGLGMSYVTVGPLGRRKQMGFDVNNGTAQLDRKSDAIRRLYGAWRFYERVVTELEGGYIVLDGRFSKAALKHWLLDCQKHTTLAGDEVDAGRSEAITDVLTLVD